VEGEGPLTPAARAFIFDLDGTLVTLPVDWDVLRGRLDSIAGRPGLFRPIFPTIGKVVGERPDLGPELFAAIDDFEATAVGSARLFPGAHELLQSLSSKSPVSLVTMQGRKAATQLLARFDLSRFFFRCFTREDSLDRAAQLEMALSSMGAGRESCVFVGDRLNDLNAARKVGVPFVLVRTHGEDPEDADYPVYHSLAEFASHLAASGPSVSR